MYGYGATARGRSAVMKPPAALGAIFRKYAQTFSPRLMRKGLSLKLSANMSEALPITTPSPPVSSHQPGPMRKTRIPRHAASTPYALTEAQTDRARACPPPVLHKSLEKAILLAALQPSAPEKALEPLIALLGRDVVESQGFAERFAIEVARLKAEALKLQNKTFDVEAVEDKDEQDSEDDDEVDNARLAIRRSRLPHYVQDGTVSQDSSGYSSSTSA